MPSGLTHLIVNSPYDQPKHHWHYHRETQTFSLRDGRRPAGYVIASESSKAFDDPGRFIPIELVNQIRPRVKAWREGGYSGVSGITRRLLEHRGGREPAHPPGSQSKWLVLNPCNPHWLPSGLDPPNCAKMAHFRPRNG